MSDGHICFSLTFLSSLVNECWSCALLSHISSFLHHRQFHGNALTGTIPTGISTLTELRYLYAPSLIEIIECWSCVLLSVGHVRLLSAFPFFFRSRLDIPFHGCEGPSPTTSSIQSQALHRAPPAPAAHQP